MTEENSFPKKGDIIIEGVSDEYWIYNACLLPGRLEGYRTGFKIAADIIAERIAKDTKDIDRIIYPLVFLYRHYIELSIKDTIIYSKEYFGEEVDYKKISGHTNSIGAGKTIMQGLG